MHYHCLGRVQDQKSALQKPLRGQTTNTHQELAGEKFNLSNYTQYLALADKLHDSGKAAKATGSVASIDESGKQEVSAVGKASGRNKGKAKANLKPATDKCLYHVNYGEKVFKCLAPATCTMKDKTTKTTPGPAKKD